MPIFGSADSNCQRGLPRIGDACETLDNADIVLNAKKADWETLVGLLFSFRGCLGYWTDEVVGETVNGSPGGTAPFAETSCQIAPEPLVANARLPVPPGLAGIAVA